MLRFHPEKDYRRLLAFYEEAGTLLDWPEERLFGTAPAVSAWSPAQHLYHVTLVNRPVFTGIRRLAREPEAPRTKPPPLWSLLLLATGWIPRGRSQAPARAVPPADLDRAACAEALAQSQAALKALASLLAALPGLHGRLPHPVLGPLNAAEWLRFAYVHAAHHRAIIRDVAAHAQALPA